MVVVSVVIVVVVIVVVVVVPVVCVRIRRVRMAVKDVMLRVRGNARGTVTTGGGVVEREREKDVRTPRILRRPFSDWILLPLVYDTYFF